MAHTRMLQSVISQPVIFTCNFTYNYSSYTIKIFLRFQEEVYVNIYVKQFFFFGKQI